MEREDYLAQIKTLSETVYQFKDMVSYLKAAHESDMVRKSKRQELILSLTNEVTFLWKELAKKNDHNKRHNKQTFGKSSLKSGTREDSKPGCEEEKQNYSTPVLLAGEEADKASLSELDQSKKMSVCCQTVRNWLRKGHELLQGLLPSLKALLLKAKTFFILMKSGARYGL